MKKWLTDAEVMLWQDGACYFLSMRVYAFLYVYFHLCISNT